jgi:hypothetical protein
MRYPSFNTQTQFRHYFIKTEHFIAIPIFICNLIIKRFDYTSRYLNIK